MVAMRVFYLVEMLADEMDASMVFPVAVESVGKWAGGSEADWAGKMVER